MQTTLIPNTRVAICKVIDGGFSLMNEEELRTKKIDGGIIGSYPQIIRLGSIMVAKFENYEEAKSSFEKQVKEGWNAGEIKWI